MQTAFLTLHVIVCLVLIVLVLLQAGKEGMGVIFGGGGNTSVFGSSGAGGILVKLTGFLAVLFIVTSLGYNLISSPARQTESVLDVKFEEVPVPAAPTTPAGTTTNPVPGATAPAATPAEPAAESAFSPVESPAAITTPAIPAESAPAATGVEAPAATEAAPATPEAAPAAPESTPAQ